MALPAFSLLCLLAAAAFTAAAESRRDLGPWLAGALLGELLFQPVPLFPAWRLEIDAGQGALLLALLAFVRVKGALSRPLTLATGGLATLLAVLGFVGSGFPPPPVLLLVPCTILAVLTCSLGRPGFRSPAMLEEAALIVLLGALLLTFAPGLLQGWESAAGLQTLDAGEDQGEERSVGGRELIWVAGAFMLSGVLWTNWKYRNNGNKRFDE